LKEICQTLKKIKSFFRKKKKNVRIDTLSIDLSICYSTLKHIWENIHSERDFIQIVDFSVYK